VADLGGVEVVRRWCRLPSEVLNGNSADDTVKAFGQAGELAKKFRSAGADYYGVPVGSALEISTELK